MSPWSARDIPDQSGRTAVVTGANSGIGYAAARELARAGARVFLACRSEHRGSEALARLRAEVPAAEAELRPLDLGDLKSVRAFADALPGDRLDLLLNNAGVMAVPYGETADGFETQIGVNHLGHFALTGLLLPRLQAADRARVVSVSSLMHFASQVDLNDLHMRTRYRRWVQYGRSKSADLLFIHELARRLARAGSGIIAAAAHPGYAATNLQAASVQSEHRPFAERIFATGNRLIAQSADAGALPTLFAATAPGIHPDTFIGPRIMGWRGAPSTSQRAKWTLNDAASQRLWEESERLTGVSYEGLG
ncbi:oxidoreductase [Streptomyces boninensis]|uniref:oxidoreductase n=1 Tax=Streptomyces boninensis TaxID=2039455 RepID=UPI003B228C91